jgi:hypothetical protein
MPGNHSVESASHEKAEKNAHRGKKKTPDRTVDEEAITETEAATDEEAVE